MSATIKRGRVCKGQSRNGCSTCRSRRVKCDENKPYCLRCKQAGLSCEGYRATQDHVAKPSPLSASMSVCSHRSQLKSPIAQQRFFLSSLVPSLRCSLAHDRFVQAALAVINNVHHDQFAFGRNLVSRLFTQCVLTDRCTNAAAAAFGAVYQLHLAAGADQSKQKQWAAARYEYAIHLLQQLLKTEAPHGKNLLVSCVLLSCIELFLRRRQNALVHLQAAYSLRHTSRSLVGRHDVVARIERGDSFELLLRTFDIQTISYSDFTRVPDLENPAEHLIDDALQHSFSIDSVAEHVIQNIHACYHFASYTARQLPVQSRAKDFSIEQGRHISALRMQLNVLGCMLNPHRIQPDRVQLLMMQNLCLSALAHLSTLFNVCEGDWDFFSPAFQKIITNTEEILQARKLEHHVDVVPIGLDFTPQLGILQPLFLTAQKYRHSQWRRRAIQCLRQAGQEGPWIGMLLAAVTERCAVLEESMILSDHDHARSGEACLRCGKNNFRITICRMTEGNGDVDGKIWPSTDHGMTKVRYLRRLRHVSATPILLASSAHCTSRANHHRDHEVLDDKTDWEVWQETIEFQPSRSPRVLWSSRRSDFHF